MLNVPLHSLCQSWHWVALHVTEYISQIEKEFPKSKGEAQLNALDLIRNRKMRLITPILCLLWWVRRLYWNPPTQIISVVLGFEKRPDYLLELIPHSANSVLPRFTFLTGYYGLTLNSGNLSADPYISTFISVAVELPAYVCVWLAMQYLPRRPSLICMILVGGLSLIFIQLVPESEKWNVFTNISWHWRFWTVTADSKFSRCHHFNLKSNGSIFSHIVAILYNNNQSQASCHILFILYFLFSFRFTGAVHYTGDVG